MTRAIDTSFIAHATVPTQLVAGARNLLRLLVGERERMVTPVLLRLEFASTLNRLHLRGTMDLARKRQLWLGLQALPLVYAREHRWVYRALEIAQATGRARIFDGIYLACAEDFGVELITGDARFARAAAPLARVPIRLVDH